MISFGAWRRSDDPSWLPDWERLGGEGEPAGWDQATASDLTFRFFRARISFSVNGVEFGVDEPNQTVLDYCLMLNLACRELQVHRGSQVQSASGSFRMYFIRDLGDLRIASDRVEKSSVVQVIEFHDSVSRFLESSLAEISSIHPEFERSDFFRRVNKNKCRGLH